MSWARIPGWWWRDRRVRGLAATARDLLVRLLSYSADGDTDGLLSDSDLATVEASPRARRRGIEELAAKGFVGREPDGWRIADWPSFLVPSERAEAMRAQRRSAGRSGGRSRSASANRNDNGTFGPGESPGERPDESHIPSPITPTPTQDLEGQEEKTTKRVVSNEPRAGGAGVRDEGRDRPRSSGRGRGRRRARARTSSTVPEWGEGDWAFLAQAWEERGFKEPPTRKQQLRIWQYVRPFPEDAADWLAGASREVKVYDVIGEIIDRGEGALRLAQFDLLDDEEKAEWFRLEALYPRIFVNEIRVMRETGAGLPDATGGENPYRIALAGLPALVAEANEDRQALRAESHGVAEDGDAGDSDEDVDAAHDGDDEGEPW